jgi:hypothetical protein
MASSYIVLNALGLIDSPFAICCRRVLRVPVFTMTKFFAVSRARC